jgi:hypothetical protein
MAYKLALEPDLIRLELFGKYTSEDVSAYMAEIEAIDAKSLRVLDRLVDATRVDEYAVEVSDFMALAKRRATLDLPNAYKVALVAPRPTGVGFARMYQMLSSNPKVLVEIFGTEAEAMRWLRGTGP